MLLISLYVSNLCLFKERKNLTLKTCAPDFSARSMTKLYAKIKGARAISLFDFPKTWQVCFTVIHLARDLDSVFPPNLPRQLYFKKVTCLGQSDVVI